MERNPFFQKRRIKYLVMMPKVVGGILAQMTRIVRFWSFAFLDNTIIAILKCCSESPRWILKLSFKCPKNDSIEFEDLGTLGCRVYENRSGIARLICETLRCSILCVNHHLPDTSSTVFSLIKVSYCRYQSTKAHIHSCAPSCVWTPFNKRTKSSSSCAAAVCGLRVIQVSISRDTCTVQR